MDNTLKELINAAHYHPSADNSQPFSYRLIDSEFTAFYDTERVQGFTFEIDNPAIQIALGCLIWNVEQRASELGVRIDYSVNESESSATFRIHNAASKEVDTPSIIYERCTNRAAYKSPSLDKLTRLEDLFSGEPAILVSDKEKLPWIELIKKTSKVRFQIKEIHELLGKAITFDKNSRIGLLYESLGVPFGSGPVVRWISEWKNLEKINRLGAYNLLAQEEVKLIKKPSVLGVLYTRDEDYIEAGKRLCELWSNINAMGLSVHPYYVMTDVMNRLQQRSLPDKLTPEAKEIQVAYHKMIYPDASPVMMLRIGQAKKQLKRSARLPIEALIKS